MRPVYLGTSDFAAAVLRRLAATREHRAGARRHAARPPPRPRPPARPGPRGADGARELGIELLQTEATESTEALARIRAAAPELGVVCAFGQLLREPLLSELELLNVHPSLLPRWRGAAPIERAIMAGDAETGVTIMRVTEGLDSGPVALAGGGRDRRRRRLRRALRAARGARRRAAGPRRSSAAGRGELELTDQDDSRATYAEKIEPGERRLDPARPAIELERRVRALTPHIGAYLELAGGERLGVLAARAEGGELAAAALDGADGLRLGCARRRAARCCGCVPPGGGRWTPPPTCAATSCPPSRERGGDARAPRRLRGPAPHVRGRRLDRPRLRGAAAQRLELSGRELAQARRLAYGSVQRRGHQRPPDRRSSPAAGAAGSTRPRSRRCGSASTSCSTPRPADHAAVDQAVELAKHGIRRAGEPRARARAAAGFVNAVLRRAARERAELLGSLDDSTPARRRGRPLLPRVAGVDVVGGARAGAGAAADGGDERAGRDRPAGQHAARRPGDGGGGAARRPGSRSTAPARAGCSTRPRRWSSTPRPSPSAPGSPPASSSPQSRGSQAVVALLDPRAGRARARPLRRPGDQDDGDRGADGGSRRDRLDRGRPAAGGGDRGALPRARAWAACACGSPTPPRPTSARATIASSWTRPAPTSGRSRPAPTPAGASRRPTASGWPALQRRMLVRAARALRPGGTLVYSTCTISARENEGVAGRAGRVRRRARARRARRRSSPARLAPRPALPPAAARARPHDRLLLRPLFASATARDG